jgi:hypothetical protein
MSLILPNFSDGEKINKAYLSDTDKEAYGSVITEVNLDSILDESYNILEDLDVLEYNEDNGYFTFDKEIKVKKKKKKLDDNIIVKKFLKKLNRLKDVFLEEKVIKWY